MSNTKRLIFDLAADRTRVHAESDVNRQWRVDVYSSRSQSRAFVSAVISRIEGGDGYISFRPTTLDVSTEGRKRLATRRIHAVGFLAATVAQTEGNLVYYGFGIDEDLEPDPFVVQALEAIGIVDVTAQPEEVVARPDTLLPYAMAGTILRQLGPTFPVGFSLSPAETGVEL